MALVAGAARIAPLMSLARDPARPAHPDGGGGLDVLNIVLALGCAAGLTEAAGIAWEAHLGGFYAGLLTVRLLRPSAVRPGQPRRCCGAA